MWEVNLSSLSWYLLSEVLCLWVWYSHIWWEYKSHKSIHHDPLALPLKCMDGSTYKVNYCNGLYKQTSGQKLYDHVHRRGGGGSKTYFHNKGPRKLRSVGDMHQHNKRYVWQTISSWKEKSLKHPTAASRQGHLLSASFSTLYSKYLLGH